MRTKFSESEILNFLEKKKNEIVGDEMILRATQRPEDCEVNSFSDMLSAIHQIGLKQGNLEGRLDLINDIFKFFEIK